MMDRIFLFGLALEFEIKQIGHEEQIISTIFTSLSIYTVGLN